MVPSRSPAWAWQGRELSRGWDVTPRLPRPPRWRVTPLCSFPRTRGSPDAQSPRAQEPAAHPRAAEREQAPLAGMRSLGCWRGLGRGWGPRQRAGSGVGASPAKGTGGIKLVPLKQIQSLSGTLNLGSRWQRPGPIPRVHGFGKPFINGSLGEEPLPGFPIPKMLN